MARWQSQRTSRPTSPPHRTRPARSSKRLRKIVLKLTIPKVEEKISWGVPFYRHNGEIGGFAAYAKHVSVGFGAVATEDRTALEAKGYKVLKDTFQIKFDQKVPSAAIKRILKAKLKANS